MFSSLDLLSEFVSSLIMFGKYVLFSLAPLPHFIFVTHHNWMFPQIALYNTNYIQLLGAWCLLK